MRKATTAVQALVPDLAVQSVTKEGDSFVVKATKNGEQLTYKLPADLSSATRTLEQR